jgi:hypothetical protein
MKKRLLFGLAGLLMLSTFGYAQTKDSHFELGGTFLILTGSNASFFGGGVNIASTTYFTDMVGIGVYSNVMYAPYSGISVVVIDILAGPVFKLIRNDQFSLPVSAGLFADCVFAFGGDNAAAGINVGVGANITAEIKLPQGINVYGRLQSAYGFLAGALTITPCIGVVF